MPSRLIKLQRIFRENVIAETDEQTDISAQPGGANRLIAALATGTHIEGIARPGFRQAPACGAHAYCKTSVVTADYEDAGHARRSFRIAVKGRLQLLAAGTHNAPQLGCQSSPGHIQPRPPPAMPMRFFNQIFSIRAMQPARQSSAPIIEQPFHGLIP